MENTEITLTKIEIIACSVFNDEKLTFKYFLQQQADIDRVLW